MMDMKMVKRMGRLDLVRTWHKRVHLLILPLVLILMTGPVPAQTIGVEELTLEERRTTRTSQAEIAGRMRHVLLTLASEFKTTRDQALVDHHRTSREIHTHFGDVRTAAMASGLKVGLCNAGHPDHVGDDWLIVWYDPPAKLRNIASPEDVQRAALARDRTKRIIPQDVLLFWIATPPDPRFSLPTGLPVPSGLADCHAMLDTDTIGMGIRPRIPVAERRVERATDTDVRTCPSGQVGAGVHYQRTKTTIRTGFDESPPAGFYSGPAGPPPAPETPPGSGVFDTGWLVQHTLCRSPRTGTRFMADSCNWVDDGGTTRQGLRIVEVGWTERQDAQDPLAIEIIETGIVREVIPCGDWGTDTKENPFAVPIYERRDVVATRDRVCSAVHGANYSLGTRTEGRVKTIVTTRWPSVLNRADDVTTAHTPWRVDPAHCLQVRQRHGGVATVGSQPPPCHDACHGLFTYEERETKEEYCGTGYTGTQKFERTREYVMREYAAPVPFVADVRVSAEPWLANWRKTGDTCQRIPTPTTHSDDDDDNTPFHTPRNDDDQDTQNCLTGRCRNDLGENGNYRSYTTIPADDTNVGQGNNNDNGPRPPKKCFLTTAVVERRGEADDGPTLTLLRTFRDGWLRSQPEGERLISDYYRLAPLLVGGIPPTHEEWDRIASEIDAAAKAISTGNPEGAYDIYHSMVERLTKTWLNQ